jgi:hypothetical protein
MDVELGIAERLVLLDILPTQGDLMDMMVVEGLRPALILSDTEMTRAAIHQEDARITWDPTQDFTKTVCFGPNGLRIVQGVLKDKIEQKKVALEYLSLYRKFGLAPTENPT